MTPMPTRFMSTLRSDAARAFADGAGPVVPHGAP